MAGEYIEFDNNNQPAVNDTNLNRLQQLIKQDIQGAVSGDTLPIGAIIPFGSDTVPENWLLCDGSAISRTQYQDLFNVIGITFGQGDGFTTFNLPNLKGKIPVGKDSNDTDFDTLGKTGGEKEHTLTIQEMPEHDHGQWARNWNVNTTNTNPEVGANYNSQQVRTGKTGGGQPHNIMQPYIIENYIIKAYQTAGTVSNVIDNLNSTSSTDALSANQGNVLRNLLNGTVLYEDSTGTIGNVTLSQDITNIKRIRIKGYQVQSSIKYNFSQDIDVTFDGKVSLMFKGHIGSQYNYIISEVFELGSTTITRGTQQQIGLGASTTTFSTTSIYITKVVGFDY